jgi:hypothetical protein
MKITAKITSNGVKREVDFQGATLPDGRSIEDILNENERLKKDIKRLEKINRETSSVLTILIPKRTIRIIVEIVLVLATVLGIIFLFI